MPHIDVLLHMRATVEVRAEQVEPVRLRIQRALEDVTEALDEYGVTYANGNEFAATVREEEGER